MNDQEFINFNNLCFDAIKYMYGDYLKHPLPIPTRIDSLDKILNGGLQPGVWCVMAEPGAGKSAFGLQVTYYTAFSKISAVYISLEMPAYQCWHRVCSAFSYQMGSNYGIQPFKWSEVPAMGKQAHDFIMREDGTLDYEKFTNEYNDNFTLTTDILYNMLHCLYITDTPQARNLDYLKDLIRESKQVGAGLVVIDYMQQIILNDMSASVYDRITRISSELKDIANELKIPIVVIVSMNRETLKGKEISMHGGSGSASIEYDASGVITLQQDRENSTPDHRRVKLKVQKNRFGLAGNAVDLDFYPAYNMFFESHVTVKE